MAKRSLGGQWDKLEERERQEFVDLFTEFLTATYVEKIHSYSDEKVTFLTERIEGRPCGGQEHHGWEENGAPDGLQAHEER